MLVLARLPAGGPALELGDERARAERNRFRRVFFPEDAVGVAPPEVPPPGDAFASFAGSVTRTTTSRGTVRYSKTSRSWSGVNAGVAGSAAAPAEASPHPSAGRPIVAFARIAGTATCSSRLVTSNAVG